jgi:hypothetical protein
MKLETNGNNKNVLVIPASSHHTHQTESIISSRLKVYTISTKKVFNHKPFSILNTALYFEGRTFVKLNMLFFYTHDNLTSKHSAFSGTNIHFA